MLSCGLHQIWVRIFLGHPVEILIEIETFLSMCYVGEKSEEETLKFPKIRTSLFTIFTVPVLFCDAWPSR